MADVACGGTTRQRPLFSYFLFLFFLLFSLLSILPPSLRGWRAGQRRTEQAGGDGRARRETRSPPPPLHSTPSVTTCRRAATDSTSRCCHLASRRAAPSTSWIRGLGSPTATAASMRPTPAASSTSPSMTFASPLSTSPRCVCVVVHAPRHAPSPHRALD